MQALILTALAALSPLCAKQAKAQGYDYSPEYWCRGFNQTGNYTQGYEDEYSHRISEAVICNSTNAITDGGDKNGTCAIQAGGFFESTYHTNVSAYDFRWGGIHGTGNYTYNAGNAVAYTITNLTNATGLTYTHFGGVEQALYHIEEGTNAYIAFTPLFRCISGRLSECPMELDLNDTFVEVCEPMYTGQIIDRRGGLAVYEGNSYIKMVNKTEAANLTGNPNEQPPTGLSTGGAGLVGVEHWGISACAIAMVFALLV
ncbi:hypothetical protein KC367_g4555 [Hortaea werneckii]|nr:hypothetical protein KC342_g1130 [Hortaea werneckii]KAI7108721.1 hypothetical protein KC339_g1326 [Hortaea werneckii]KAI7245565.1 hypothetical protein KC365_g361 [Hortaea werneckii]KAI7300261.1 hypothetical protein KC340_g13419 [Hortaea werneckii]KAI7367981.1 hypothetical protein KC354_g3010 [Hortaea werneckii]